MPLSSEDFASIARFVELEVGRLIGRRRDSIITARVIKADVRKRLIWVKEIPDQPIPVVAHDHDVTYFDESPRGTSGGGTYITYTKQATSRVRCPNEGELAVITREMGSDGWPKCIGVVHGYDYIKHLEDG
jgi:hypothetical protein